MAGHGHVDHGGDKRIALLIAVLALCLALVETGAKSAQTAAITRNVEAANLWAFFQARTIRQTTVRTAAEEAELARLGAQGELKSAIEAQQKRWRDTAARWESEPDTGEGRKELSERAKRAEAARDRDMAAYHLYEYGAAAIQVAIVVASASIVTGVGLLAVGGIALGLVGLVLGGFGWLAPLALHL
jgi:hypothetical protein